MAEMIGPGWQAHGKCTTEDPELLFVVGAEQNTAKRMCNGCDAVNDCLAHALDNNIETGVWGGRTERERRALRRRFPNMNWHKLIMAQIAMEGPAVVPETGEDDEGIIADAS